MSDPTPDSFATVPPLRVNADTPRNEVTPDDESRTQPLPPKLTPSTAPGPDEEFAPGTVLGGRYNVIERVGVGGMGVVLRVFDRLLERELAVKVMKGGPAGNPELTRRFLEEAKVCGQLQHPGVVPLHELDHLPDGSPFFTMKLVRGRTLGELLRERTSPGADLPRFVKVFEQICQAIAYAHSLGIIHRDLKPSNVMVGAFGEVQVMDWGLAKAIALRMNSEFSSSSDETAQGTILGTPAYMPPEQARGITGRIDRRSDVFALGAILCEILTGQPPYTGRQSEAHAQAADGAIGPARERLTRSEADGELVTVARMCLQPKPEDRPADAAAVATLVSDYLAGVEARLLHAQAERAAAQVRAQEAQARAKTERRARRLTLGLALTGLLLVVGAGGAAWWWQGRRSEADALASAAMNECRRLRAEAWADPAAGAGKLAEALAFAENAASLAANGSGHTRREAEGLRGAVRLDAEQAEKNRTLLTSLLSVRQPRDTKRYKADERGGMRLLVEPRADEQFQQAFRRWGLDLDHTSLEAAVTRLQAEPPFVVQEIVAGLDEWTAERQKSPGTDWRFLTLLADRLDQNDLRREMRRIRFGEGLLLERAVAELLKPLTPWLPLAVEHFGANRQRLRDLAGRMDLATEPVLAILALHHTLETAGNGFDAERLLRDALVTRPEEVLLRDALGKFMEEEVPPRWDEAVRCYEAVRAVRPELGAALGNALLEQKHLEEAEAVFRDLVRRDPKNPQLYVKLANALEARQKDSEAEAAYRHAVQLAPSDAEFHAELAVYLREWDRLTEAEEVARRAVTLGPHELARACHVLGLILLDLDRPKEAEVETRKALALEPNHPYAHNALAAELNEQKRFPEAEAAAREAIRVNPSWYMAYSNLRKALEGQGKSQDAELALRRWTEVRPRDANAYYYLADLLDDRNRLVEAEAAYRKAIDLDPEDAASHNNLGRVLSRQGRPAEAEGAYRNAIVCDPEYSTAHYNLGLVLMDQARFGEAAVALQRAASIEPDDATYHGNLGRALYHLERFSEAETACRMAIERQPNYPAATLNLGLSLLKQKKLAEALQAFEKASQLQPNNEVFLQNVQMARRFARFCDCLPAILEHRFHPAGALELAEIGQYLAGYEQRYALSVRYYCEAFQADPKLSDDMSNRHYRYDAACYAALAAVGKGADAGRLSVEDYLGLSQQARGWLRAHLAAYAKMVEHGDAKSWEFVRVKLWYWKRDSDLAGVREPASLAGFPEDERRAWLKFWADVEELLKKVNPAKK